MKIDYFIEIWKVFPLRTWFQDIYVKLTHYVSEEFEFFSFLWKIEKKNAKFTSVIISVISAENDMKGEEKIDKNYGIAIRIDNKWWRHNNFTQ